MATWVLALASGSLNLLNGFPGLVIYGVHYSLHTLTIRSKSQFHPSSFQRTPRAINRVARSRSAKRTPRKVQRAPRASKRRGRQQKNNTETKKNKWHKKRFLCHLILCRFCPPPRPPKGPKTPQNSRKSTPKGVLPSPTPAKGP